MNEKLQLSPVDASCVSKIKKLESVVNGDNVNVDAISLKSKLATFLLAHADKVMDTVAPLEQLREEMVNAFIEKSLECADNPEVSPGTLYNIIDAIQSMNAYAVSSAKGILDADKLSTNIVIDASDKSVHTNNSLNLNDSLSRARVIKAVDSITKLIQSSEHTETGGDINDNESE